MLRSLAALAVLTHFSSFAVAEEPASPVYELRIYKCEPGKLDALHERFEKHTMQIFEKHGMKNVAYWTPTDDDGATTTLIYLLEHASRDAAKTSWDGFRSDPEWQAVAKASADQHGKILAERPEAIYLTLTDYSPKVSLPTAEKTYELRVYKTGQGKLAALHSRFRDHTDKLFQKHGMQAMAYWSPMDEPKSSDTMYYVLETANRDAANAGWKGFIADPDWQAAYKASTENGKLLSEAPTSIYMKTTKYSPTKE